MTDERLLRSLGAAFDDLAAARTPDYLEAAIERASSRPQRPAWTLPGRWLPMADIASRSAFAPRLPWRQIGLLALIAALLVGLAAVYVGSQRPLPQPFGLADNGLIAASRDGDIVMIDPTSGAATIIIGGPDTDLLPQVSPDGTHLAFLREDAIDASLQDLVVARVDGSGLSTITPAPVERGFDRIVWAPDSRSILADMTAGNELRIFDVTKATAPRSITADMLGPVDGSEYVGLSATIAPFQPPDGRAVLIRREGSAGSVLIRLELETLDETVLAGGDDPDAPWGTARWSPDGTKVVYQASPAADPDSQRLFIVNADGTDAQQITSAPGTWFDIDPSWSPAGDYIAFTRYESTPSGWDIRPTGIYSLADHSVREVGPLPRDTRAAQPSAGDPGATAGEGFWFEWSPDGMSFIAVPGEAQTHPVIIDVATGAWRSLDAIIDPSTVFQSWQRVAP